jgi:hypothetical protein
MMQHDFTEPLEPPSADNAPRLDSILRQIRADLGQIIEAGIGLMTLGARRYGMIAGVAVFLSMVLAMLTSISLLLLGYSLAAWAMTGAGSQETMVSFRGLIGGTFAIAVLLGIAAAAYRLSAAAGLPRARSQHER